MLHGMFNHSGDSAVDYLQKANQYDVQILTKDKERPFSVKPDCGPFHLGKQTRAPFHRDINKPNILPLDVISTYTAGSFPMTAEGNKYIQLIIDRASKETAAIPLKAKSSATDNITGKIATWQHLIGRTATRYHSDNAKEPQPKNLVDSLKSEGTIVTSTVLYSSQQNPDAERVVRTITDATRCALQAARMRTAYCVYAAVDASNKYSALPQTGKCSSPDAIFFSREPAIARFQVFGQTGFVTVNDTQPKLAPRARLCRHLLTYNEHQLSVLEAATGAIIK